MFRIQTECHNVQGTNRMSQMLREQNDWDKCSGYRPNVTMFGVQTECHKCLGNKTTGTNAKGTKRLHGTNAQSKHDWDKCSRYKTTRTNAQGTKRLERMVKVHKFKTRTNALCTNAEGTTRLGQMLGVQNDWNKCSRYKLAQMFKVQNDLVLHSINVLVPKNEDNKKTLTYPIIICLTVLICFWYKTVWCYIKKKGDVV